MPRISYSQRVAAAMLAFVVFFEHIQMGNREKASGITPTMREARAVVVRGEPRVWLAEGRLLCCDKGHGRSEAGRGRLGREFRAAHDKDRR